MPTHSIDDVKARITKASEARAREYCEGLGVPFDPGTVRTSLERLHNNAYERSPDSPEMKLALAAGRLSGLYASEPVVGFDVSCDARLFADHLPECQVITFGAGEIGSAHSEAESVTTDEILKCAETLAYFALAYR